MTSTLPLSDRLAHEVGEARTPATPVESPASAPQAADPAAATFPADRPVGRLLNRRLNRATRADQGKGQRSLRGLIGLTLVGLIVAMSLAAPLLAPFGPEEYDLLSIYAAPSSGHPFGFDEIGRDVLSRVIWGGRPVLLVTVLGTALSVVLGVILGFAAAGGGKITDTVVSRIADIQLSIPALIFALLAIAMVGSKLSNLVIVLALASWPLHFRVVRAQILLTRRLPYVEASRLSGSGPLFRARKHLLPSITPLLAVTTSVTASTVAISATGLSYLGLGVITADWGRMIASSKGHLADAPWAPLYPSLALVTFLLGIQLLADAISARATDAVKEVRQ
ncbi:MAG: ABC transporter permease [Propionibacteriaceae bacterium]|jgi:peptide/nickel transport system permease protein|nr:ABC transporter permease [Propionibacteriaceae bacterium]